MGINVKRWLAAYHEAGHAVIRYLASTRSARCGLPQTGAAPVPGSPGTRSGCAWTGFLIWLGGYLGDARAGAGGAVLNLVPPVRGGSTTPP